MAASLSTRKSITDLTPADLEAFPVWEFAMDEEDVEGQDETWVRPVDSSVAPLDRVAMQVATEFRAAGGTRYPGFSMVTTRPGDMEVEPVVLLVGGGYLHADDPDELLEATGLTAAELLPMTYELRVLIEGEQELRGGALP